MHTLAGQLWTHLSQTSQVCQSCIILVQDVELAVQTLVVRLSDHNDVSLHHYYGDLNSLAKSVDAAEGLRLYDDN